MKDNADDSGIQEAGGKVRALGIAKTIARQERFGQMPQNQSLVTSTAINKILFQLTAKDAQELALEFAEESNQEKTEEAVNSY